MSAVTEPLVLLSGLASDQATWARLTPLLEARCEMLVAEGASIEAMAQDVLARAPERFALAGHSMGGYVALAVAAAAPGRVTRLALLNSSAAPDRPEQTARRLTLIETIAQGGYAAVVDMLLPAFVHPGALADAALAETLRAMMLRAGPERFGREQRAIISRPDRRGLLETLAMPFLALGSQDDKIVAPADAEDAAGLAPQGRLAMLDYCGHMAPLERPEAVAAALKDWLAA